MKTQVVLRKIVLPDAHPIQVRQNLHLWRLVFAQCTLLV